ncbi:sushi, von Willebrand factor type A, EGF and pentraxin domain-containing protein 1 [Aplysia californica]|uniref:Sushi, von Willebrand factor type A, EGF and pentraxin domain-containing protein 1 n=1 Tax=Aplysia californica TaxID=6500 RepID=A0ABM0K3J5_APLCA|nr:sushi, von Willebrand factor type A, EGF and pentraxin domain-containing protein 1 [Aplysia californica]
MSEASGNVLLLLLAAVSCTWAHSRHPILSLEEKGCVLKPTMSLNNCLPSATVESLLDRGLPEKNMREERGQSAPDQIQVQDQEEGMYGKMNKADLGYIDDAPILLSAPRSKVKVTLKDNEKIVEHATVCVADRNSPAAGVLKCRGGMWTKMDVPETPRNVGRALILRRFKREKTPPNILCPSIGDVTVAKFRDDAFVSWNSATSTDANRISRTAGPNPGSWLKEGRYWVTYVAQNSDGLTSSCSATFEVIVKRCDSYMNSDVDYGQVLCSRDNIIGSVCSYSCNSGYELLGDTQAQCLDTQQWNILDKPVCKEIICPRPSAVPFGTWDPCDITSVGAPCNLTCDQGFEVDGNMNVFCRSDKTWTTPGTCKDVEAPTFTCPGNLNVSSEPKRSPKAVSWLMPAATDNSGENIVVTSDPLSGDLFPVGVSEVTFEGSDSSGNSYSCKMFVEVKVKYCSTLPSPDHAIVVCSHDSAVGSDCDITCSQGFQLSGVATRTCLDNTEWSDAQPSCLRGSCGPTSAVSHGSFNCSGHDFEDVCFLKCDSGYKATGPLTSTCEASLQWSLPGSCTDVEPPVFLSGCSSIVEYAASLGLDTQVLYDLPQVADNSGDPVSVSSSRPSGSTFDIGFTNVTVEAIDTSGNSASCMFTINVFQIQCPAPENTDLDDSADRRMQFSCPDGHVYGAKCDVSCSDGNPVQGVDEITCEQQNRTDVGYWWYGNIKPYCDDSACPAIDPPQYGALVCDVIANKEVCTLQCREGYAYPVYSGQDGFFICLKSEWQPVSKINTDVCIAGRVPTSVQLQPDIWYYSGACSQNNTSIKENFISIINDTSILDDYCTSQNITCVLDNVSITCGPNSGKREADERHALTIDHVSRTKRSSGTSFSEEEEHREKRSTTHITKAAFTIKLTSADPDGKLTRSAVEDLTAEINNRYGAGTAAGKYDMPNVGTTDNFSYGWATATFSCPAPTNFQPRSDYLICVGCGRGYFSESGQDSCSICPTGTYQPFEEADSCVPCPNNATTKTQGATSEDSCLAICHEGHHSKFGYQPCDPCPRGSYQGETMSTSCLPCPHGMSSEAQGATSVADCKYFELPLASTTEGPSLPDMSTSLTDMTVVTFVKVPSDLSDTVTTFSLSQPSSSSTPLVATAASISSFGCEAVTVYMETEQQQDLRSKRQWHHVALVHQAGTFSLFVNGNLTEHLSPAASNLTCSQLAFSSSGNDSDIVISELQAVGRVLTVGEIQTLSSSCGQTLENNILVHNNVLPLMATPSTCDAVDECASYPCGDNGVCVDLSGGFRCICEDPWFGDQCQTAPSFCDDHKCANGAVCQSLVETQNYTCVCAAGYRGALCTEEIVDGAWGEWAAWSLCGAACGGSDRSRDRRCDKPPPGPYGQLCSGPEQEVESCNDFPCPVDGGVSTWGSWYCHVTCGNGTAVRHRTCDDPSPEHGGRHCSDHLVEFKECDGLSPCPVNGGVSGWGVWSHCTADCGTGSRSRSRSCNNPAPQHGGQPCDPDDLSEEEPCNTDPCPTCPRLARRVSHQSVTCETNSTTNMQVCTVVCPQGYMIRDRNFTCGPLTGYEWSHKTPGNPNALLPDCTVAQVTTTKTTTVSGKMDDVVDPTAVRNGIQANVDTTLNCTGICSADVAYSTSTTSGIGKRSTGQTLFTIEVTVQSPDPSLNIATASTAQLQSEMAAIILYEDTFQTLINTTVGIFNVTVNGQQYRVDVDTLTAGVDLSCPDGTELLNHFCVDCDSGTYSVNNSCEVCDIGQYQELTRQSECLACPSGTTTLWYGSKSSTDCTGSQGSSPSPAKSDDQPIWIWALIGVTALVALLVTLTLFLCVVKKTTRFLSQNSVSNLRLPDSTPNQRNSLCGISAVPTHLDPDLPSVDKTEKDLPPPYEWGASESRSFRPMSAVSASGISMGVQSNYAGQS